MTGRYPFRIGYYDMTGTEAVGLEYTLLPQILKGAGWRTAAIGKWDLGAWTKEYTPTFRGFDSFAGYYNAALKDYWYHGGSCSKQCSMYSTDLSNSSGLDDPAGVRHASAGVNGTYDADIFTAEALRQIRAHGSAADGPSLYVYLAYQNVHTTAQVKTTVSGQQPFQAPCATVDGIYAHTESDAVKVLGSMVTELDYGFGNVTAALKAAGRDYLIVLVSDNGGPVNLGAANFPARGGKHTLWDGGLRVVSVISGSLIPLARRGRTWDGLAHSSDLLPTIVAGIAGVALPQRTGPQPVDGHNLWPAILGNQSSPRTEIIHQVSNNWTKQQGLRDPPAIRSGRYKLILGEPGDATIRKWPDTVGQPVEFGHDGGTRDAYSVERGLGHCRSPHINATVQMGLCGGRGCLFDLVEDESESNNLINDTGLAAVVAHLKARLAAAALTGPPWAFPYNKSAAAMLNGEMCAEQNRTGYFEPVRVHYPTSPPPPPGPAPAPGPEPVWKPCIENMTKHCPCAAFGGTKVSGSKCHIPSPKQQALCSACGSKVCDRPITVQKYCGA